MSHRVFHYTEACWSEVRNVGMAPWDAGNAYARHKLTSQCTAWRLDQHAAINSLQSSRTEECPCLPCELSAAASCAWASTSRRVLTLCWNLDLVPTSLSYVKWGCIFQRLSKMGKSINNFLSWNMLSIWQQSILSLITYLLSVSKSCWTW